MREGTKKTAILFGGSIKRGISLPNVSGDQILIKNSPTLN